MSVLLNLTKEIEILNNIEIADTFESRLKGLLGRRSLDQGVGLIISPCNSVHCFFMKFSIDVAFIDKNNKVVKLIGNMKPGSVSPIISKAKFVIESNVGELTGFLEQGDEIRIV